MESDSILVSEVANVLKKTCDASTEIKMKMNPNMSTIYLMPNTIQMVKSKTFQHVIKSRFRYLQVFQVLLKH